MPNSLIGAAFKACALMIMVFALSACFRSETALIGPGDADFPFETITYADPNGKEVTLDRVGDAYINPQEGEASAVRLKSVDESTFIGQIAYVDDEGEGYLYGLIRLTGDRKAFYFAHAVAGDEAKAAAARGEHGFSNCDENTVCLGTLDGFIAFSTAMPVPETETVLFTIVEMK